MEMAARNGFDGIEICGIRPHAYAYDMNETRCAEIRSLAERLGIEISMYTPEVLMYPYNVSSPYKKEREDTIAYLKKSIDVAKALGTTRMQVNSGHPGFLIDRKEAMDHAAEVMSPVCEYAEEKGVDIIFECLTLMESSTIVLVDNFLDLQRRIWSPRLKSMLDSAMVMTNWEPVDLYFEKLGDSLRYVHWGDSHGGNERHLEAGMGRIDPESFFRIIRNHGYDGWVSLELYGEYIREPEMHSLRELNVLRRIAGIREEKKEGSVI